MRRTLFCLLFITQYVAAQESSEGDGNWGTDAQTDFRIHSHNDYVQNVPFWKAISAGASSLEADVFLVGDALYVAHTEAEIDTSRSFEKLYLEPIVQAREMGLELPETLQLLIDIKSETYATLDAIVRSLENYPSLIKKDASADTTAIGFTISGNRPEISEYLNYPDFIHFDYQSLDAIEDPSILKKISLISLSFRNFSEWNGKGRLTANDLDKVTSVIEKAHSFKKPFRFWATPDSKTAWKAFTHLGVDFINTDMPFECVNYLATLADREYRNTEFSDVYRPSFASDGRPDTVENIILMIGDGNGLAQISASTLANGGELSLTQLKSIGFIKTQSADDFTTDSAGAGTAIATGQKAPNRAIGADSMGRPLENLTELLHKKGFISGIVTTDQITGATPAAFYAHRQDRGMSEGILEDLAKSQVSVFVNSATEGVASLNRFHLLRNLDEVAISKKNRIGVFFSDKPSGEEERIPQVKAAGPTSTMTGTKALFKEIRPKPKPIATAVKNVLQFLEEKQKPFFLLAEGAKIDSYGHANDIGGVIDESIAFDRAIAEALRFADAHKNTLVIITADHETGGLTLPQGNISRHEIEGDFTTDDHTGIMVPVFAYGPRSNEFQGVYANSELFHKIRNVLKVPSKE